MARWFACRFLLQTCRRHYPGGTGEVHCSARLRDFLSPAAAFVVVSRLRKDACLYDLPAAGSHGNRIYGKNKISLAKRRLRDSSVKFILETSGTRSVLVFRCYNSAGTSVRA